MWAKKIIVVLALAAAAASLPACATRAGYDGAMTGAAIGGAAGALLSPRQPWRGAAIGGALGALLGGSLADSAALEQARYRRQRPAPPPPQYRPQNNYREYSHDSGYRQPAPQTGWRQYDW